jgi:hypothetical protein
MATIGQLKGLVQVPITVGPLVLDTLIVIGAEVVKLPATSRATAVTVCEPFVALPVFQVLVYGALLISDPKSTPSR